MIAKWFANNIADVWMTEPVHPENVGYTKFMDGILDEVCGGPVSAEEIMSELKVCAEERGYDYEFKLIEDYNIDRDTTDYIIEWRQKTPVREGE